MKTFLSIIFAFASLTVAQAQCNEYYVLQDGSEWEYETYNAKGKLADQPRFSQFAEMLEDRGL